MSDSNPLRSAQAPYLGKNKTINVYSFYEFIKNISWSYFIHKSKEVMKIIFILIIIFEVMFMKLSIRVNYILYEEIFDIVVKAIKHMFLPQMLCHKKKIKKNLHDTQEKK